ncbi:MAG: hypothetical protein ACTSVI_02885 [Promethearchaeota archaeon]
MFILEAIFNLFFFGELIFISLILMFVAWKFKNKNPHVWTSALISGIYSLFIAFVVPPFRLIPYPYIGFLSWWSIAWIVISLVYYAKVRKRRITSQSGSIDVNDEENVAGINDGLEKHHEWIRKAFHLAGLLLILSYYVVGPLLAPIISDAIIASGDAYTVIWGSLDHVVIFASTKQMGVSLTLFALSATLILVACVDVARVLAGEQYSLINIIEKKAGKILREKEKGSPGPQLYITLSALMAWVIGLLVDPFINDALNLAVGAVIIATLADGAAAVIGKNFGKHVIKRPYGQIKTVEGLIAGAITAFLVAWPFTGILYALIGAGLFFMIDLLSPPISDNVINSVILMSVFSLIAMSFV